MPHVLFLHVGWARKYQGVVGDVPVGHFAGGDATPGECLNFKEYGGFCYGYAAHHKMDLAKLGGNNANDHVDGVLVVWTATDPAQGGRYIVGWYHEATIYAKLQKLRRQRPREAIVKARSANCHLVPVDERTFFVPSMQPGWPGQARAYYASHNWARHYPKRLQTVHDYVGGPPLLAFPELLPDPPPPAPAAGGGWSTQDPELRVRIEEAAVQVVKKHYENQQSPWQVRSVEAENLGWDLNVRQPGRLLRVEVKGRGGVGAVQITPNEYAAMRDDKTRMSYRLAIVHNALSDDPVLTIFQYDLEARKWISATGPTLTLEEMTGAVASFQPAIQCRPQPSLRAEGEAIQARPRATIASRRAR